VVRTISFRRDPEISLKLFLDYLADVTFLLGKDSEVLKAHKIFLMNVSPIFHAIFTSPSAPMEKMVELRVSDITKATMMEVCKFAYCDAPRIDKNNVVDILKASSKLQVKPLLEKAVEFIKKDGLTEHTVFRVLEANLMEKNLVINLKCFAYIEKNHAKCLKTRDFQQCSAEIMRLILQACKLPANAAEEAIQTWLKRPGNKDEGIQALAGSFSL
jgi:BTB/POZ domain